MGSVDFCFLEPPLLATIAGRGGVPAMVARNQTLSKGTVSAQMSLYMYVCFNMLYERGRCSSLESYAIFRYLASRNVCKGGLEGEI